MYFHEASLNGNLNSTQLVNIKTNVLCLCKIQKPKQAIWSYSWSKHNFNLWRCLISIWMKCLKATDSLSTYLHLLQNCHAMFPDSPWHFSNQNAYLLVCTNYLKLLSLTSVFSMEMALGKDKLALSDKMKIKVIYRWTSRTKQHCWDY